MDTITYPYPKLDVGLANMKTLASEAGISGREQLRPPVFCGMELLIRGWDTRFWCQIPHMC